MPSFSIKVSAIVFGAVAGLSFLAMVLVGQATLHQLKVGGPVYEQLVRGSSLISDILPPPEYIVESYLEAAMALETPNRVSEHHSHIRSLRQRYENRRNYWMNQAISPVIKKILIEQSDRNAQKFYDIAENNFIPALEKKDLIAARTAFADMRLAYQAHHAAIDRLVIVVTEENRETEVGAADQERKWTLIAWTATAVVMALLASGIAWLIIFVIRPLGRIAASIRPSSRSWRALIITEAARKDEIGAIASAIEKFRDSVLEAEGLRAELAENQISVRSAQEASKAKSAFLANMSHELRTPLNAIIGFSEFMIQGLFGPLNEKYKEYAGLVHQSGLHLLDVISDILDMAKVEAGRFDLNLEEIDLDALVSDCIAMMMPRAQGRSAVILVSGTRRTILRADRRALRQILLNLLSNAVKFCGDTGLIDVRVVGMPDHISIEVHDDGKGIAPEQISRLGRPFEQVTQDSNLARGGTGLGLALVFAMAGQHGGSVKIESRIGEGTNVRVTLPRNISRECLLTAC
jgi:signal transduction histidine kinase